MNRRTRIIIIAVASFVLALILLFILWWLLRPKTPVVPNVPITKQGLQIPANLPTAPGVLGPAIDHLVPDTSQAAALRSVAVAFSERYGSYSNQNSFANLESLNDIVTVPMKISLQLLEASSTPAAGADYYGITTRALSETVDQFDDAAGHANLTVSTQRQESKHSTVNPRVFYQPLYIELVRDQGKWKVNAAAWGKVENR